MIGEDLEACFHQAISKANELKHEYLTSEILLWALMTDKTIAQIVTLCGASDEKILNEIESLFLDEDLFSTLSKEQIKVMEEQQKQDKEFKRVAEREKLQYRPEMSLAVERILQRAAAHVQSSGKDKIQAINVFVALFREKESLAVSILENHGISRMKVLEHVAHKLDRPLNSTKAHDLGAGSQQKDSQGLGPLEKYCLLLNSMAQEMDPLIGREKELNRTIQILGRRRKNNPLFVGGPGVGKTALAYGLAQRIEKSDVPKELIGTQVYELNMASLLAGTKFRGDFEERMKEVIEALKTDQSGKKIVFIDEVHTIMGAGSTSGGSLDASNLLKPALASGEIKCIGSTTHAEYRKFMEKDQALSRRFQKVDIKEPSVEDTLAIIKGLIDRYEKHHNVIYSLQTQKKAIELSQQYLTDRLLPDKAIDVIDEAGSFVKIKRGQGGASTKRVTIKDLEEVVSMMAKVPKASVSSGEKEKLRNLQEELKKVIFGQNQAIETLCDAIFLARSGIANKDAPMGQFLFAGPTGVGKTELAKQLALQLGIKFIRFDMSEYMEKHSVAKFIGAPPGYVGFEEGGLLTDAVHKSPYCVLLLDEIEKAHPDLTNILLQIMDYGLLTDAQGKKTDFRNVTLIFTTNAGASELQGKQIGLSEETSNTQNKRNLAIKRLFSPEFRNRLSAVVHFSPLELPEIKDIVGKFLKDTKEQLQKKKLSLEISEETLKWIAEQSYDPELGARPIERYLNEHLKKKIAKKILLEESQGKGIIRVQVKNNELKVTFLA